MRDIIEPILPQIPVEEIALHIGRSRLSIGDKVTPRLTKDGQVGLWARVRRPWLGLVPMWRDTYLGHLGPVASQILAPAVERGTVLRMRVVVLHPEHLSGGRPPEIHVSAWGDPRLLKPFLETQAASSAERLNTPRSDRKPGLPPIGLRSARA